MLDLDTLMRAGSFAVTNVRCTHERGDRGAPEVATRDALIVPQRGVFTRRVGSRAQLIEPNVAYFQRAGDEQQVTHPVAGGDSCVSVELAASLVTAVASDDLPADPFPTHALLDWRLRRLSTHARVGLPADDLEEDVVALVAAALESARQDTRHHRPSLVRVADQAREALAADPGVRLIDLARHLGCSPDHLSRTFQRVVGTTFTFYRSRLRIRRALDLIAAGDVDLAHAAVSAGFADQSHMTRSMRLELGITPARARVALGVQTGRVETSPEAFLA